MRHMLAGDNLALVTRRQMITNQPANYFFVADSIVIDGLIRSDNRGSESFFPLYVEAEAGDDGPRRANFTGEFCNACGHLGAVSAEDLFYMIYAQFHSAVYRNRYRSELCLEFPRVFVPRDKALFQRLVACGRHLVDNHLLRAPDVECRGAVGQLDRLPTRDFPRFAAEKLWLSDGCWLDQVPAATWDFHIGGYQVCRKWLRDRAGRLLATHEIRHYSRLVTAVSNTLRIMAEIDSTIAAAGGWPNAFVGSNVELL
jgi:hypothetical protein